MTLEIAKLNRNIQKRLTSYLEAVSKDFLEAYRTDGKTQEALKNAIGGLTEIKSTLKQMHGVCLDAAALGDLFSGTELSKKEQQYNELLKQLDRTAEKAGSNGLNLLKSNNVSLKLDDDAASELVICGIDATAGGLGLSPAKWKEICGIKKSAAELNTANRNINQFLQKFNNFKLIIVTWEEFIKNLINILQESALDSIMFDLDTEQANILALQTAQKMTRNSLLAANQTTQNILKLI